MEFYQFRLILPIEIYYISDYRNVFSNWFKFDNVRKWLDINFREKGFDKRLTGIKFFCR